jgi:hypothetical protein
MGTRRHALGLHVRVVFVDDQRYGTAERLVIPIGSPVSVPEFGRTRIQQQSF